MNQIVSAVVWEGKVYIFTQDGTIYMMTRDYQYEVSFVRLVNLFPAD